jgi:TPR repeat protein
LKVLSHDHPQLGEINNSSELVVLGKYSTGLKTSHKKGARDMARMDISTEKAELAAQGSMPDALFELGMLYATGRDVAADLVSAHKWFNLAAARGNRSALSYRVELAREMSSDQIAEAQKLAREWLQTH